MGDARARILLTLHLLKGVIAGPLGPSYKALATLTPATCHYMYYSFVAMQTEMADLFSGLEPFKLTQIELTISSSG